MVIEVDPGTGDRERRGGRRRIPLASTQPNVNPDEVLASLDADTQAFLKLLLAGGAEALDPEQGRGRKLSQCPAPVRALRPRHRPHQRRRWPQRRENIARSIHNFRLLSEELGNKDEDLTAFVDASNAVLQRFANQEAAIRESLRELPGTLERDQRRPRQRQPVRARDAARAARLAAGRPGAGAGAASAAQPFLRQTAAPIRDQIRPFTQAGGHARSSTCARRPRGWATPVPGLKTASPSLNEGLNALAFNPGGTNESYLFYLPWLNHNTNNLFLLQDAHGPLRRGIVLQTCETGEVRRGRSPASARSSRPFSQATNAAATRSEIC